MSIASRVHLRSSLSLLLALCLLLAQLCLLAHAAEHDIAKVSDEPHAACLLCHAADGGGHGLCYNLSCPPPPITGSAVATNPRATLAVAHCAHRFHARAPPVKYLT
jgi:hypothetical protein